MTKATLRKSEVERDPSVQWDALIDVIGGGENATRTEIQQSAHYCFRYDGEVQNDGHFQFFENNGLDYALKVATSLEKLGLIENHKILSSALMKAASLKWGEIESVEEFVEASSEGVFDREDGEHYELKPDLLKRIQAFASAHPDEFFEFIS